MFLMDNSYCCVPQCNSLGSHRPRPSFHRFPREKDDASIRRRKQWICLLRIGKEVSNRMVVCGKHFQPSDFMLRRNIPLARTKLKPNALPSLNLPIPVSSCENRVVLNKKKKDSSKRQSRKKVTESASVATIPEPEPAAQDGVMENVSDNKTREIKIAEKGTPTSFLTQTVDQLFEKQIRTLPPKNKDLFTKDTMLIKVPFKDKVIELAFNKLPNESIHRISRNHTLKEDSVRTISPNELNSLPVQTSKRKESAELNKQLSNDFYKLSAEVKNIPTPNSLWSVACTEDSIIFAKWNSKGSSERRVIICKDLSMKTFLMNVEISLSVEGCTIENISQLLQNVDDLLICKNANSGASSGCLGFVVDKRQGFCCTCYNFKNEEKEAQSRNTQILVGKKIESVSQVKNIINKNTNSRKKVSDLKSDFVESKHQSSQTKEAFLEAISHLSSEQQTAIKSCHSFKTWFL